MENPTLYPEKVTLESERPHCRVSGGDPQPGPQTLLAVLSSLSNTLCATAS